MMFGQKPILKSILGQNRKTLQIGQSVGLTVALPMIGLIGYGAFFMHQEWQQTQNYKYEFQTTTMLKPLLQLHHSILLQDLVKDNLSVLSEQERQLHISQTAVRQFQDWYHQHQTKDIQNFPIWQAVQAYQTALMNWQQNRDRNNNISKAAIAEIKSSFTDIGQALKEIGTHSLIYEGVLELHKSMILLRDIKFLIDQAHQGNQISNISQQELIMLEARQQALLSTALMHLPKTLQQHFQAEMADKFLFEEHAFLQQESLSYSPLFLKYQKELAGRIDKLQQFTIKVLDQQFQMDQAKLSDSQASWWQHLGLLIFLQAITILLAFQMIRSITKPLSRLRRAMQALSEQDLDIAIPAIHRKDEIGEMARAVKYFKKTLMENVDLTEQQMEKRRILEAQKSHFSTCSSEFKSEVGEALVNLDQARFCLTQTADSLSKTAETTTHQATNVADSSAHTSTRVNNVAEAIEEMAEAIEEIGRQAVFSSDVSHNAVQKTDEIEQVAQRLSDMAKRIGIIVETIKQVAEQTNLLALNATIEAARAGDAGKGFAVVANEVKILAGQTAQATHDIESYITDVQNVSQEVYMAVNDISDVIHKTSDIAYGISTAVEEQHAALKEISENVQEVATRSHDVSETIEYVSQEADNTNRAAKMTSDAVTIMTRQTESLRSKVEEFVQKLHTAY